MNQRRRLAVLAGVVVLALVGALAYVLLERKAQRDAVADAPPVASRDDLEAVTAGPHLLFRSTALGPGYGQVAAVPLTDPGGPRAFTPASCERIYAVASRAICLSADRGLVTTYRSQLLDGDWAEQSTLPLTGLPSRARLSDDGSLVATTTFVFGDSYADPGQFSTRTLISSVESGTTLDLETFTLVIDGQTIAPADRNYWGVTFADDDTFYATAATGGRTWLVRGSLSERRLTSIRPDVECPSLSPDKTRIVFKRHGDLPPGQWRLAVYDLRTGVETLLSEQRSVDDQAVWLDDSRIIYGLPRSVEGTATSDVWVVNADGSAQPQVFVHDAWSPSVVNTGRA